MKERLVLTNGVIKVIKTILSAFLVFSIVSCGDDDDDDSSDRMVTTTFNQPFSGMVMLTDSDGDLIGSTTVDNATTASVARRGNERFTLVLVELRANTIEIYSYSDIQETQFTRFFSTVNFPDGPVTLNVDPTVTEFIALTGSDTDLYPDSFINNPDENLNVARDGRLCLIRNVSGSREFAIYENLTPGDEVNVVPSDFMPMQFQPINDFTEFVPSLAFLGYIDSFDGASFRFSIGFIFEKIINDEDEIYSLDPPGLYYPGTGFNNFYTQFGYQFEGFSMTSAYYGSVPVDITPIDVTEINVNPDLEQFTTSITGSAESHLSSWASSDALWLMVGPANGTFNTTQLIEAIEAAYPQFNLNNLDYLGTTFSDHIGISYDEYIAFEFDEGSTRFNVTEIRSVSYRD